MKMDKDYKEINKKAGNSPVEKKRFNRILIADISMIFVAMIWGSGYVITKDLLQLMTPFYFLGVRFCGAAIILGLLFWKRVVKFNRKLLLRGSLIGLFLFLGFASQTVGLIYTTPARQGFITGTNVVIVPFLYMLVTGKSVHKNSIIGAFLAAAGLAVISFQQGLLGFNYGDFLTLLGAFFYAGHVVAIGVLVRRDDPIGLTIIQLAFTGLLALLIAVFSEPLPAISTAKAIWELAYLILFSSIISFLVQNIAQTYTFTTHAAILLSLESVFGAFFSWMFWGEEITIKFILGAGVILSGIFITELKPAKKEVKSKAIRNG